MGLNERYKERIKESLDPAGGGRLHAVAAKAASVDAPVLIIGLGGTGMDSLLKTKKLIHDTIKAPAGKETPEHIEFLGFDTDKNYEKKSYQGMRLNKENGEVHIMTMENIQPFLKNPKTIPPHIRSWLDRSIDNEQVIYGAAGVRQLGRLLFMQNYGMIEASISTKIKKITAGYPTDTPLYVIVIAGISGGTGSGTFIDIPYLVRAVSRKASAGRVVSTIGILFMPDANANKTGVTQAIRENIYRNGFASLKELDYLMNIGEVGDTFTQQFGNMNTGANSIGSAESPYDICLLMSSKDKNGRTSSNGDKDYENLTSVAAETIFNFVVKDDGVADVDNFSIQSWLSNETTNVKTYKAALGDSCRPVSYRYSIAGASSAKLPLDDVMSYLAYKMFEKVKDFWWRLPEEEDIEEVADYFHLSRKHIYSRAMDRVMPVNTSRISVDILKTRANSAVAMYENALTNWEHQIQVNLAELEEALRAEIAKDTNIICTYLHDLSRGPMFAQRCLFSTSNKSIVTDLENLILELSKDPFSAAQIAELEETAAFHLTGVQKSWGKLGFGDSKLKEYLKSLHDVYECKKMNIVYREMKGYCERARSIVLHENNKIFDLVSDLLNEMMKVFEKYGDIRSNTTLTAKGNVTTLSWNVVDTPAFITVLERTLIDNTKFTDRIKTSVGEFYKYLFENYEKWSADNTDVVEEMNSFIYRQFQDVLDDSFENYLEIIANSQGKSLQTYCQEIVQELLKKAEVRYPVNGAMKAMVVPNPKYSFISIPGNCPTLYAIAYQIVKAVSPDSIVKQSGIKDRIYMMNFESATPLCMNADIEQFYRSYIQFRDVSPGLHYYVPTEFGNSDDWRRLPSPYPESEWPGIVIDAVERERNDEYREVYQKALDYGYIAENVNDGSFTCMYGNCNSVEELIRPFSISLGEGDANSKLDPKTSKNVRRALEAELKADRRRSQSFTRKGSVVSTKDNGDRVLDRDHAEMLFIQMFRIRDRIRTMVENHEAILEAIREINERTVDEDITSIFVQSRILNLIRKDDRRLGSYLYLDRKGIAHTLVSLDGRKIKYQEHYLLDAFTNIPKEHRDDLRMMIETQIADASMAENNRESLTQYKKRWIDKVLDDLRFDYLSIDNGETLLINYQMMNEVCEDTMNLLGGDFE